MVRNVVRNTCVGVTVTSSTTMKQVSPHQTESKCDSFGGQSGCFQPFEASAGFKDVEVPVPAMRPSFHAASGILSESGGCQFLTNASMDAPVRRGQAKVDANAVPDTL